jgi:cytochrome c6
VDIEKLTFQRRSNSGSAVRSSRRPPGFGTLVPVVAALVILGFVPQAVARNADDSAAAQSFKSNCVVCHGADGTGTPTGKSLKVPDLHSDAVQKMTDQQIQDQIANGKNNMPPFKSTLTKDQIAALAAYVHSAFRKKK